MRIAELSSMLEVSKENIRYYESEGLLSPKRSLNGYRDYSDDDVKRLKDIIVLRRLGVSVAEIREVFEGSQKLSGVLQENLARIDEEMSAMEQARRMCRQVLNEEPDISDFHADRWLKEMSASGNRGFGSLGYDVLGYSRNLFVNAFGTSPYSLYPILKPVMKETEKKGSLLIAVLVYIMFILWGGYICSALCMRMNTDSAHPFLTGMIVFALIVLFWIILSNAVYWLSLWHKKNQESIISRGSVIVSTAALVLVILAYLHWSRRFVLIPYRNSAVFMDPAAETVRITHSSEAVSETGGYQLPESSLYWKVSDQEYITSLKNAILSCKSTGRWSSTRNRYDYPSFNEKRDEDVIEIQWRNNNRSTFFYLYRDEAGEWILDEPNYGVFTAGKELTDLVEEYDSHLEITDQAVEWLKNIFEYDPEEIHHEPLYEDGRYDYYSYLTLRDSRTGEDITESFIAQYREAWLNQDWQTLLDAMKTVNSEWIREPVNPVQTQP